MNEDFKGMINISEGRGFSKLRDRNHVVRNNTKGGRKFSNLKDSKKLKHSLLNLGTVRMIVGTMIRIVVIETVAIETMGL